MKTFGTIKAAPGELQPDCMFQRDEDGSTKDTSVHVGKYADLQTWTAQQTQKDGVSYELVGTPGGLGRLKIVTGTGRYAWTNTLEPGVDAVTYDWIFPSYYPFARPIITFHTLDGTGAGSREGLLIWMNEPDAGLRKLFMFAGQFTSTTDFWGTQTLTGAALQAAQLAAAGIATFDVWLPVVDRVRRYVSTTQPLPQDVGSTVPGDAPAFDPRVPAMPEAPPTLLKTDYQWRKTKDRADPADINDMDNRVWIRRERWVAEMTPEALYPGLT